MREVKNMLLSPVCYGVFVFAQLILLPILFCKPEILGGKSKS
jgi:hypothetical protein